MHVHLGVDRVGIRGMFQVRGLDIFLLVFLFSLLDGVHTVVFVGFFFIVLLFIVAQLLPCGTDKASHTAPLRWYSAFCLFETDNMGAKEHVVSSLVSFASLFVWRIVGSHLFLIAFAVRLGTVGQIQNKIHNETSEDWCASTISAGKPLASLPFLVFCFYFVRKCLPFVPCLRNEVRRRDALEGRIRVVAPQCFVVLLCQLSKAPDKGERMRGKQWHSKRKH